MKNYVKLTKSENNRDQEWFASVEGSKVTFRWGIRDGKFQELTNEILEGRNLGKKNATTKEQQALFELRTTVNKKMQEGYIVAEVGGDCEDLVFDESRSVPKPMLAQEFHKHKHKIKPNEIVYVQKKYDGIRCLADLRTGLLYSRKGLPILGLPHINTQILKFGQQVDTRTGDKLCDIFQWLDGEAFVEDLGFQGIMSIVRKSKGLSPELEKINYNIYDFISEDLVFGARNLLLKKYSPMFEKNMILCDTFRVTLQEVQEYHDLFVNDGYEGAIIRRNTKYQQKRTADLLKLKDWFSAEFELVPGGFEKEEFDDTLGAVACIDKEGRLFSARPAMPDWKRKELWDNRESFDFKNHLAEITYQELTDEGLPRFNVLRALRHKDDC